MANSRRHASETFPVDWWRYFKDPLLNRYIEKGAKQNQDVLIAESNILQARALRTVAASSLFPQIIADVNATKTYFSKNGPCLRLAQQLETLPTPVQRQQPFPFQFKILKCSLFTMPYLICLGRLTCLVKQEGELRLQRRDWQCDRKTE